MKISAFSLFLTFFLLLSFNNVYAIDEGFHSTISFTIGEIGKEGVSYNPDQIVGEYTEDVVLKKSIGYLTNDFYKSRIFNKTTSVALPPFSTLDIGYYWYNNTQEDLDIDKIRIPLAREMDGRGDATNLLYENEGQEFVAGITCSNAPCKGGKYVDIDGVGILSSGVGKSPKHGVIIDSFTLKPAIEIARWEVEIWDENLSELTLYVRNNTDQILGNVWINYKGSVSKIIEFQPHEERKLVVYKQCILSETDANCGSIRIIDPNTKTECIGYGSDWGNYLRPDSITVWSNIGGEWVSGAQTQPDMETFCIQRIPYNYITKELIVYFDPPETPPTQQEYWQNLLGLETLPITSYGFNIFEKYLRLIKPVFTDNLNIL